MVSTNLFSSLTSTVESGSSVPDWIPVAALVAAAATLLGLFVNKVSDRRERRRTLYSEAYQAALAWEEVYYRIRRRDPAKDYELAASFHSVQERINFHEGWIGSESVFLGRAYCRLVLTIKAVALVPIQTAWREPPSSAEQGFSVDPLAGAEQIKTAKERFVEDLRDHMSLNPLRRGRLAHRYENSKWPLLKEKASRGET
jgi:hypothetical protein